MLPPTRVERWGWIWPRWTDPRLPFAALLTLYGVQDEEYREALMTLARQSKERTWWTDYRDLMLRGSFVGLEAGASAMRTWEPIVLPGLLQTEDDMRALIRLP